MFESRLAFAFEFRLVCVMPYRCLWSSMTEEVAAAPVAAPPETRGRWRFWHGRPEDAIDSWWNLRVYFYAASRWDYGVAPFMCLADLLPHVDADVEPRTYEYDVRNYLGEGHFMGEAGLSGRHDGRHPSAQMHFWERMCGERRLARLVLDVAEALSVQVSQCRRRVFIRLQCSQGRHRSIAGVLSLAKIFALIFGISTQAYMYDEPARGGRHPTRLCGMRGCDLCARGAFWDPPRAQIAELRRIFADHLARRLAVSPAVEGSVWAALLAAVW